MIQRITKAISTVMLTGIFIIAVTGCEKALNKSSEINSATVDAASSSQYDDVIPDSLQVPGESRLMLQAYATGVQIYQVQRSGTDNTVFQWVNVAPSATLYAKEDYTKQLGTHYQGPTWEFIKGPAKGEKVVAARVKASTQDPAAIPWLLLKAVDSLSSAGNKITYIQRIFTQGGIAPVTPANEENLGELDSIPYTALYLFYTSKH